MRLRNFRTFLAFCAILLFIVYFALWKFSEKPAYRFLVKIPPLSKWDDAPEEVFYWEFQKFLFPKIEIPNPLPKGLPNDDSLLQISLEKNKKLKINLQEFGNLEDTALLTKKLSEIFSEREKLGVYEPNSDQIVKAVIVKAPRSATYGDVVKIIDAVKSSGADPIILQIDDLPE